jgi:hypothetical protein
MAGIAEYGKLTDKQLDQVAKHAAKGFIAELDGDKVESDAHYERARTVIRSAEINNKP